MRFIRRLMEIKEEQLFHEEVRNMMIATLVEGLVKNKAIKEELWQTIEQLKGGVKDGKNKNKRNR